VAITEAVIPVGGLGTRLLPATRSQPKEMLPVVDKPVVQYVTEELSRAGITRVLFVTGRRKRAIEDHFDDDPELERALGEAWAETDPRDGMRMLYTRQRRAAGLGDALRYASGFADERALVAALGDTIIVPPPPPQPGIVSRLIEAYDGHRASAALAVEEVDAEAVSRYGIVTASPIAGEVLEVLDVTEKPAPYEVASRLAIAARYVLGPAVFAALDETAPDPGGEVQLTDALKRVIAGGGRVVAVPLAAGERRLDIGTVESYCRAFIELALGDPRFGPRLRASLDVLG
jgi:UTP--glucose-1-phosphate uridylyltransferase